MSFSIADLWRQSPRDLWARFTRKVSKTKPTVHREDIEFVGCLSTGRVGSKTLAELGRLTLGESSQHEPKPHLFGLGKAAYESTALTSELLAAVEACREEWVCHLASSQQVYLETSPQVTFLAPAIAEVFPRSRFIHVVRHPFDVIRSGMRRQWYAGHGHDRWRIVPQDQKTSSKWDSMDPFEKNVWLWAETNRWIDAFSSELDDDKFLQIKSEELFAGSDVAVGRFFKFIGTPKPAPSQIDRILGQNLNSQKSGTFPESDQWSDVQKSQIQELAGDLMERWGYRLD